jgi:hypothetical protein
MWEEEEEEGEKGKIGDRRQEIAFLGLKRGERRDVKGMYYMYLYIYTHAHTHTMTKVISSYIYIYIHTHIQRA